MLTAVTREIIVENANLLSNLDLSRSKPLPALGEDPAGKLVIKRDSKAESKTISALLKKHMLLFQQLCKERFNTLKEQPLLTLQDYYTTGNALNGLLFYFDQQIKVWFGIIDKLQQSDPNFDLSQFDTLTEQIFTLLLELRANLKFKLNTISFDTLPMGMGSMAIISPKSFLLVENNSPDLKASIFANFVLSSPSEGYYEVSDLLQFNIVSNPLQHCSGIFLTWNCYPETTPPTLDLNDFKTATFTPKAYLQAESPSLVPFKQINLAVCISHTAALGIRHFDAFLLQALVEITVNDNYGGIDLYAPRRYSDIAYRYGFYGQKDQTATAQEESPIANGILSYLSNEPLRHFHLSRKRIDTHPLHLTQTATTWQDLIKDKPLFSTPSQTALPVPFDLPTQTAAFLPNFNDIMKRQLGYPLPQLGLDLSMQPIDNAEMFNDCALKERGQSIQIRRLAGEARTHLRLRTLKRK